MAAMKQNAVSFEKVFKPELINLIVYFPQHIVNVNQMIFIVDYQAILQALIQVVSSQIHVCHQKRNAMVILTVVVGRMKKVVQAFLVALINSDVPMAIDA
jgi:hypothetical protein